MSDYKKTFHIQIDGHNVSAYAGKDTDRAVRELIRAIMDLAEASGEKAGGAPADKEGKAEKLSGGGEKGSGNMDSKVSGSADPSARDFDGLNGSDESDGPDETEMDDNFSAMDVLRALHFLTETMSRDEEAENAEAEKVKDEEMLTRDQKNVLVGFDVACDAILMFLANLDLYRDQIQRALVAYGYDARDYESVRDMVSLLFSHNALSALAVGEPDGGEEKYGSAFLVYKSLRDALMDYMENSRKHIVASFTENEDVTEERAASRKED